MEYNKTVILKDGRTCLLRNGTEKDGEAVFEIFNLMHAQTDFLLSYPDENNMNPEEESKFLKEKTESENEIEIVAVVDGKLAGLAGIGAVGKKYKVKHRAEFGISVEKSFWHLGIGRALTESCIECAKKAGFMQLELDVVAQNASALSLYKSVGFKEYGKNPRGFSSRTAGYQELVLMRLELD
ncbi:GNAT family N-acetyltransferase [Treponema zioleckii]|uniref:GNAT family N-acetyltransferase n=1 Tax=Treponema zioleckii TaxID=331680 RepID=UPI00168BFD6E|nr:GNAT family N-acetyltransferase [Treponema zioleckii]